MPHKFIARPVGFLAALCAAVCLTAPATAEPTTSYGKVVHSVWDAKLGVTETRLANGLTILTKEVHASPVAYFGVYYNVGSRNEITGQTGLSHILEHMMFKGTDDLPPGAIDRLFSRYGFAYNASTDIDVTEYHELIPSDKIDLAAHVEADRMVGSKFDPAELTHEMVVVRSELEGDAADPVGQLSDEIFTPLAFQVHPYRGSTIGWRADVENAAKHRDAIYRYYLQHYMPNNAVVVIVGDFQTARAVAICQKYFGAIKPRVVETHYITPEPPQTGERRAVLRRPGSVGHVTVGWRSASLDSADHDTLDVIATLLGTGASSRLYQALVEKKIAQSVSTNNPGTRDPYMFEIDADASAGVSVPQLETAVEAEVERLKTGLVSSEELSRAVNQIDAQFTYQSDGVTDQAAQIGFYQIVAGDYRYLETYLPRIHKVTPADIQRVARAYFTTDKRVVAAFDPLPLPASSDAASEPVSRRHAPSLPSSETAAQTRANDAIDAKFDKPSPAKPSPLPLPVRRVLPNGMVVLVLENHANKTVSIAGMLKAGSGFDPPRKYGLSSLTANLLARGANGATALEIAKRLEGVGATLAYEPRIERTVVTGHALSKDFHLTLATLADELRHPDFAAGDIDTVRSQALSDIEDARQDSGGTDGPGKLAEIALAQAVYPKGHPYWQAGLDDQAAALKSVSREDIVGFYGKYYRPDAFVLAIVGDVNADQAVREAEAVFGTWPRPTDPVPAMTIPDVGLPVAKPKPISIPVSGSTQTSVYLGSAGLIKRSDPEYYAMRVLNAILGGDVFSSRLGKAIRDQRGLAYTVQSRFHASHGEGPFTIFAGTNPENASEAASLMLQITAQVARGSATPREVKAAEDLLSGSFPLSLETNEQVARNLLDEEDYGLGLDFVNRLPQLYRNVTVAQVNAVAKRLLHPERMVLIESGSVPGK